VNDPEFDVDDPTRQELRAIDPARSLPPADADAMASLLEDTMSQPTYEPDQHRTGTGLPRGVLGVGVAAAAILAVVTLATNGNDDKPAKHPSAARSTATQTVTKLSAGAAGDAKCMMPSAKFVAKQTVAIEGTVVSVKNGIVTIKPSHFYAGRATDLVTVDAPDLGMSELPVDFQVGKDYIVGSTDGHVSICGLSGLATNELRALYVEAFGK
jgi:hypothetical protein